MRPFLVTLALILGAFPAAAAAAPGAAGDGTLVVRDANAKLRVVGRGTIFGRFDHGTITIIDRSPDDFVQPQVIGGGAPVIEVGEDGKWIYNYKGDNVRFRFFGGKYSIRFVGTGINISAVGRGTFWAAGNGTVDDGEFVVDGLKRPIPLVAVSAPFGTL
jgi:hypothetical protein